MSVHLSSPAEVRDARLRLEQHLLGADGKFDRENIRRNLEFLENLFPGNGCFWQAKRVARRCLLACTSEKQFRAVRKRLVVCFGNEVVKVASACRQVKYAERRLAS